MPKAPNNSGKGADFFLTKFWMHILGKPECKHIVDWAPDGRHLVIYDTDELMAEIKRRGVCKQKDYDSFARQLRIYRWGRVRTDEQGNMPWPAEAKVWRHPTLNNQSPVDDVSSITRNAPPKPNRAMGVAPPLKKKSKATDDLMAAERGDNKENTPPPGTPTGTSANSTPAHTPGPFSHSSPSSHHYAAGVVGNGTIAPSQHGGGSPAPADIDTSARISYSVPPLGANSSQAHLHSGGGQAQMTSWPTGPSSLQPAPIISGHRHSQSGSAVPLSRPGSVPNAPVRAGQTTASPAHSASGHHSNAARAKAAASASSSAKTSHVQSSSTRPPTAAAAQTQNAPPAFTPAEIAAALGIFLPRPAPSFVSREAPAQTAASQTGRPSGPAARPASSGSAKTGAHRGAQSSVHSSTNNAHKQASGQNAALVARAPGSVPGTNRNDPPAAAQGARQAPGHATPPHSQRPAAASDPSALLPKIIDPATATEELDAQLRVLGISADPRKVVRINTVPDTYSDGSKGRRASESDDESDDMELDFDLDLHLNLALDQYRLGHLVEYHFCDSDSEDEDEALYDFEPDLSDDGAENVRTDSQASAAARAPQSAPALVAPQAAAPQAATQSSIAPPQQAHQPIAPQQPAVVNTTTPVAAQPSAPNNTSTPESQAPPIPAPATDDVSAPASSNSAPQTSHATAATAPTAVTAPTSAPTPADASCGNAADASGISTVASETQQSSSPSHSFNPLETQRTTDPSSTSLQDPPVTNTSMPIATSASTTDGVQSDATSVPQSAITSSLDLLSSQPLSVDALLNLSPGMGASAASTSQGNADGLAWLNLSQSPEQAPLELPSNFDLSKSFNTLMSNAFSANSAFAVPHTPILKQNTSTFLDTPMAVDNNDDQHKMDIVYPDNIHRPSSMLT